MEELFRGLESKKKEAIINVDEWVFKGTVYVTYEDGVVLKGVKVKSLLKDRQSEEPDSIKKNVFISFKAITTILF